MAQKWQRAGAVLWLVLLFGNPATGIVPLLAEAAHRCACNQQICWCHHKHTAPAKPTCHTPGDEGRIPLSLQSCARDDDSAVQALPYVVLPPHELAVEPIVLQHNTPANSAERFLYLEVEAPPPRLAPA